MIKILLKHLIYEQCINVLFDGICRNFLSPLELINLRVEKILAVSRRISAKWSLESADWMDLEQEMQFEIHRNLLASLRGPDKETRR